MSALGQFASLAYQTLSQSTTSRPKSPREKAETALRELAGGLEAKVRCLVDANIKGIFIWDLEGRIGDVSEAFLNMVEYNREDLVSGRVRWTDLTPPESGDRDQHTLADVKAPGSTQPYEKEFMRKDGSRVPVLVGGALFEAGGNEGVAFVLDLTEQKRARRPCGAARVIWRKDRG